MRACLVVQVLGQQRGRAREGGLERDGGRRRLLQRLFRYRPGRLKVQDCARARLAPGVARTFFLNIKAGYISSTSNWVSTLQCSLLQDTAAQSSGGQAQSGTAIP